MKKFLFFTFILLVLFLPFSTYALSVSSGNAYLYNALGNQNVLPEYDNNYGASGGNYTIDIMNPSSFSCLRGSTETGGYYGVTKQINITINTDSNLTAYQKYRLKIVFDGGNYITYTDYYGWGWHANRDLTSCTNTSACSISWQPSNHFDNNPPYYSDIDIEFTPNTSTNNFVFTIGNRGNIRDFTMWNRLGTYDCVNFNYSSLENISGGSTDLSGVENKIDEITGAINDTNDKLDDTNEKLDDINDTLTDDSIPNNSTIENSFANIDETADSTLSGVLTAPIRFINSLTGTCHPQSFTLFHQSFDIPCGTTLFWQNSSLWSDDEFIGEFPTFWNIFVGGLILYRLLLGVKRAIDDALDPQKSDTLGVDI